MKKTKAVLLFTILSAAACYAIAFVAFHKGGTQAYYMAAIPIICLGVALMFSVINGFHLLYPVLTGLFAIPLPLFFFNISPIKSVFFGCAMAVIALVGVLIGTIIYAIVNKSCGVTSRDRRKAYADKPLGKSRSQAFRSEKPIDFSEVQHSDDPEKDYLEDAEDILNSEEEKIMPPERPEYVEYTNEELIRRMRGGSMNAPVSPSLSKTRDKKFDTQRLPEDFQTWFNLPVRKDIKDWATYDGPSITEKAASKSDPDLPDDTSR